MKLKSLGLCMVMVGMLFTASFAHAGQITATHTILSQQQTAVTVNITLFNQSGTSLSNVSLQMLGVMVAGQANVNTLTLASIAAGASVSASWSISILDPQMAMLPLIIEAVGTDANGNLIHFPLISEVQ